MDRYNEVKILLKDWEQSFVGQHERKPNKEDIDQAPEETKQLYKEYRNLKQAKENSSINNGSNGHTEHPRSTAETNTDSKESGCWGSHLNRSNRPVPSPSLTPLDRESLQASSQYYGMKLKSNLTSLTHKERPVSMRKSLTPGRTPLKSWKDSPAATTASSPLTLATPAKSGPFTPRSSPFTPRSSPFTPRSSPFTPRRADTCPGSLAMKTPCPTEPEAPFETFDPALMSCDESVGSDTNRDHGSNCESMSITPGKRPALVSRLSLLDRGWLERCQVFGEVVEGERPVAGNREAELERIRQEREVELERVRQETRELELERMIQEEMEDAGVGGGGGGDMATEIGETASGGVGGEEGTGGGGRKAGKRQTKGQVESEKREDGDEDREVHGATPKPAPQSRRRGGKKKAMAGGEGGEGAEGGQGDVDDEALPETKGVKKKRGAKRQREGEDTEGGEGAEGGQGDVDDEALPETKGVKKKRGAKRQREGEDTEEEMAEEGGVKKRQRTSRKKKEAGSDGNTTPAGEGGKKKKRRKKGEEDEDEEEKKDIKPLVKDPQENLFGEVDEEDAKANRARRIQIIKPSVVKNSDANFVKINLKKKSHVKGYAMRGMGLRKQMVMQKFALKGERFGGGGGFGRGRGGFRGGFRGGMNRQGDTCLKCGGIGHWAMDCKGPVPPPSLSQVADTVEEVPFELPTLEEVARATGTLRSEPLVTRPTTNVVEPDQDQMVDSKQDEVLLNVIRPDYERPAPPPPIEPLYSVGDDGKVQATPADVYEALNNFGYQSFRPGQEEAIMRILSGLSTLVVLSTGMGKSLCYQLPAYLYAQRSKSITLVVSPLVSLMDDQVSGLPPGLKAACIHSNMSMKQREAAIEKVKAGEVCVLLLSPEALVGGGGSGSGCLPPAQQLPPVAFACIDEAHCVSEWSHNFRPCYLRLCKVLRERLGVRCILGLTATATLSTALDIAHHLDINDEEGISVRSAAVPPNLVLSVSMDREKDKALVSLLKGDRFGCLDSIIVYCTRRDETIRVSALLRTCLQGVLVKENIHLKTSQAQSNPVAQKKKDMARKKLRKPLKWQAESYHAGMSGSERRRVQNNFMCGELRVVVATVAFGMGLDKSDVRGIVHYNMPKSFESYVQEIGRAGRDGQPAHCHLFLDPEGGDLHELRRHIHADTVDFYTVKRLVQMAFPSCKCRQIDQKQQELAKRAEDIEDSELLEMMDFCEQESSVNSPTQPQMVQSTDPGHQRDVPLPPAEEVPSPPCEEEVPPQHKGDKCKEEDDEKEQVVKQKHCPPSPENQGVDGTGGHHGSSDPEVESVQSSDWPRERVCHTHERAIPMQQTVEALDITEEGLETLLCYLELHPQRFVELLHPTLSVCKITCYDGPKQLQKVTKICPPVAVVLARKRMEGQRVESFNGVDFDVVEVADTMGWQLPLVKRGLRQLQFSSAGGRSGILVDFSGLSFYFRSFGDLSDEEMDRVCQFLHKRVLTQEKTQLYQLKSSFKAFRSVSFNKVESCVDELDDTRSVRLKNLLSNYFDKRRDRDHLLTLDEDDDDDLNKYKLSDWEGQIRADIRGFLSTRSDEKFSGRAVARIFQGISSPCYPAQVYGRDRRYWRKYIQFDHNQLIRWAIQEIIRFK